LVWPWARRRLRSSSPTATRTPSKISTSVRGAQREGGKGGRRLRHHQ
ncbi:unnamed protein product, partial [Ascophyllum nodosum]